MPAGEQMPMTTATKNHRGPG